MSKPEETKSAGDEKKPGGPKNSKTTNIDLEPTTDAPPYSVHEDVLDEITALDLQQRVHRGLVMKRYKAKIATARKRLMRVKATNDRIKARARKKALGILRSKFSAGKKYGDLSTSEKIALDKRLSRIPSRVVSRLAQRQVAKVRQADTMRIASLNASSQDRREDINAAFAEIFGENLQEKKHHMLFSADGKVKHDKRFRIFKKTASVHEDIEQLSDMVEDYVAEMSLSPSDREQGTPSLVRTYAADTPGQRALDLSYIPNSYGPWLRGDLVDFEWYDLTDGSDVFTGVIVNTSPATAKIVTIPDKLTYEVPFRSIIGLADED